MQNLEEIAALGVKRAIEIANNIKPLMAGHDPAIQGSVLVELLSLYLAGFPRQCRDMELHGIVVAALDMVKVNEKLMFGEAGHPYNEKAN